MALSADSRIILLRVKVERAKHHFRDLERELLAAKGRTKYVVVDDYNPDTGELMYYPMSMPVYPFTVLAIAGDLIHCLRSALDHLAYQLAIAGSDMTPTRRVEFPIAKDWDTYKSEKTRKLEGIRPEAIEAIDGLKPYKGGNEVLWKIHDFNNIDKHRFILTVGSDVLFTAPWIESTHEFLLRPKALKADAALFSGALDDEEENRVKLDIAEALGEPEVEQSNALLPSLRAWVKYVEVLIIAFRPFLDNNL